MVLLRSSSVSVKCWRKRGIQFPSLPFLMVWGGSFFHVSFDNEQEGFQVDACAGSIYSSAIQADE